MDLLTIGGITVAVIVGLAACLIVFKLLSRETTFEEAYSDNAIKLLTNQPIAEKINKKDKHKHKQKRKQSPKNGVQNKHTEEEVVVETKNQPEMQFEVEKSPLLEHEENVNEEENNSKQKRKNEKQKQKMKSKSLSIKTESKTDDAMTENGENGIANEKLANGQQKEEKTENTFEKQIEVEKVTKVGPMEEKSTEVQKTHSVKKSKKSVSLKDISMPRVVGRLKEIGELESEYITYLQDLTNEVKAKENKLRNEIKELKTEKNEFEMNSATEVENLRIKMEKIEKEKKEQNDRHLVFEQTVRQKLVETVQLKEENKRLAERLDQVNAKFAQTDHQFTQRVGMINHELIKAREECAKHKNCADAVTAEAMKRKKETEEALRNSHINFEGTLKALQTELNKEREQRMAAKNMVDQLMADVSNSQNQLKDAVVSKSVYDDRIQSLQNELNREKDHHMKVMVNAQKQVGELSQELEKALVAYGNLAKQQSNDSVKCVELTAHIKQMDEEISQLKKEAKCASEVGGLKNSVAELTKCLDEQKTRNEELKNEKDKLMDDIKEVQSKYNSQMTEGPKNEIVNSTDHNQLDRLTTENQNYKRTLDSLKNQLEKVSSIAEEVEREKDMEIAKLEGRLESYEK